MCKPSIPEVVQPVDVQLGDDFDDTFEASSSDDESVFDDVELDLEQNLEQNLQQKFDHLYELLINDGIQYEQVRLSLAMDDVIISKFLASLVFKVDQRFEEFVNQNQHSEVEMDELSLQFKKIELFSTWVCSDFIQRNLP